MNNQPRIYTSSFYAESCRSLRSRNIQVPGTILGYSIEKKYDDILSTLVITLKRPNGTTVFVATYVNDAGGQTHLRLEAKFLSRNEIIGTAHLYLTGVPVSTEFFNWVFPEVKRLTGEHSGFLIENALQRDIIGHLYHRHRELSLATEFPIVVFEEPEGPEPLPPIDGMSLTQGREYFLKETKNFEQLFETST